MRYRSKAPANSSQRTERQAGAGFTRIRAGSRRRLFKKLPVGNSSQNPRNLPKISSCADALRRKFIRLYGGNSTYGVDIVFAYPFCRKCRREFRVNDPI